MESKKEKITSCFSPDNVITPSFASGIVVSFADSSENDGIFSATVTSTTEVFKSPFFSVTFKRTIYSPPFLKV